jgi:hypothetical protein
MGIERGKEEIVAMAPPNAQEDLALSMKLFSIGDAPGAT